MIGRGVSFWYILVLCLNYIYFVCFFSSSFFPSSLFAETDTSPHTSAIASPITSPITSPTTPQADSQGGLFSSDFKKEPTYIQSDELQLLSEKRFFEYRSNVEVRQGDFFLSSNTLEGTYDEENQIDQLTAKTNVFITKGPNIQAKGEKAVYNRDKETMTLTGSPELKQNDSTLTADRVVIFLKENRSVAEGQVRVKMAQGAENQASGQQNKKGQKGSGSSAFFK